MTADSNAFETIQKLPGLTAEERQYLLTVSRGEGFYGLGWGNPSAQTIRLSEQFGIDPKAGVGSNNWGAEQGTGSAGSFPHLDHHADGSPYVEQYKKHHTPEEGAASVARTLLKPNVRAALNTGIYLGPKAEFHGKNLGPLQAAVYTQHDNRYFELHPDKYLLAAKRNYDALTSKLQWPPLLTTIKETIAGLPLAGLPSSEPQDSSSGEPSGLPEAGFLRGEKYSVPGIQDEPKKEE